MEQQRKKQLLKQVGSAYNSWIESIDQSSNVDDIEQVIETISQKLAFGTIIVTGRKNPGSYIGTFKQCNDLKKCFGGQIGAVSNVWYWIGFAYKENICKIVNNKHKDLIINVPVDDVEEATLNIGEMASIDIKYGSTKGGRASYIGSYKVCILLHQKFGGRIGRLYNHWHWVGNASFDDITEVCKNYQSKSKRFKRKMINLNF